MLKLNMDDGIRKVCSEIFDETGKRAHVVDATWKLPSWNGLLNYSSVFKPGRPSCYFQPRGRDEVVAACKAAVRHGLKVSARGSGHHYGGTSLVEGCLLLDLSAMRGVQVDPTARVACVGPAVTSRQLRSALVPHGLHFPLPHLSDVGLSGYLLGGGNGWGVRSWGAAADNIEEIEVVLLAGSGTAADVAGCSGEACEARGSASSGSGGDAVAGCRLVRVRANSDPELFWGLRGGGSFLGVATEFVLSLHPVPPRLPLITATYPLNLLDKISDFFREFHSTTPTCVEASMAIIGTSESSGAAGHDAGRCGGDAITTGAGGGMNDDDESKGCPEQSGDYAARTSGYAADLCSATAVVVVSCHAFAEPGSEQVEASYAKLRALLPDARLSLQEGPLPYEEALSVLDASWNWPGLCMYGHGIFVPVASLYGSSVGDNIVTADTTTAAPDASDVGSGGVVAALAAAASGMTSSRSILLVCPSAPLRRNCSPSSGAATLPLPAANSAAATCSTGSDTGSLGSLGFRDTFYLGIYGMWTRTQAGPDADGDAAHVAWVRSCAAALKPYTVGMYVNEVMHDDASQVRSSYEEPSYVRLQALKRRIDPLGLLRSL